MVLPPPERPAATIPRNGCPRGRARPWTRENLGAHLDPGVLFCQVGDPKVLEAVMVVDQTDRNLIHEGQQVDIKLEGFPAVTIHSKIKEIAGSALKVTSQAAVDQVGRRVAHEDQPADRRRGADEHDLSGPRPIDDPAGQYRLGLRGQARIHTGWISLGARLWRLLTHTFNFKLG